MTSLGRRGGTLNVPGAGRGGTGGQPAVELERRLMELTGGGGGGGGGGRRRAGEDDDVRLQSNT